MRWLSLLVALAACEGAIATPEPRPVDVFTEPEPVLLQTLAQTVTLDAANGHFVTVTWDLASEVSLPGTASIDVRASGDGVELLTPRFTALAGSRLFVSKLGVGVGGTFIDAFEHAGPGLVVSVAPARSPVELSLRFDARVTADDAPPPPPPPPPPAAEPSPTALESGKSYQLVSTCAPAQTVAIANASLDDAAPVVPVAAQPGHDEQVFTIADHPAGGVTLIARHSGQALNVPRASTDPGAQLIQWRAADSASANQRFTATREPDGAYRFAALNSGLFMTVTEDAVVQAADMPGCTQRFVLKMAP